jgi:hypothetical protein
MCASKVGEGGYVSPSHVDIDLILDDLLNPAYPPNDYPHATLYNPHMAPFFQLDVTKLNSTLRKLAGVMSRRPRVEV